MSTVRRRVHYAGRVQGVGFRFTCQRLAERYAVGGHVRNLSDGRVELLVEGESEIVDRLLAAVRQQMDRYIRDVTIDDEPCHDPRLTEFTIRY